MQFILYTYIYMRVGIYVDKYLLLLSNRRVSQGNKIKTAIIIPLLKSFHYPAILLL
jgi:hypothetical protein